MRQIIKDAKKIDALILYFETVVSTMEIEGKGWYGDNVTQEILRMLIGENRLNN
mgnify:CR=1 FL=1